MNEGIWIPANVWALELPPLHRVFLARVVALTSDKGGCFAGDEYLAGDLGCTPQYVRKMRKKLQHQGYLVVSGYGHKRKLTVELAPVGTSNHRNKQPQAQKLQPEAQELQPQAQLEATTVAHTIDVTKEKSKEQSKEREVVWPFESEEFKTMWGIWIQERKDRRYKKLTPRGEQAALHDLQEISGGDEQTAIKIIKQSIAKNWQGLFPLKNNGKPQLTPEQQANNREQLARYLATGKV